VVTSLLPLTARVLQLIRNAFEPLSKAEVAEILGTSQSAASMHIDRLLAQNLIKVSRIGPSQGGRKPMQFTINETFGYILTIELRITSATIAITDFNCKILHKQTISILIEEGPDKVLQLILQETLTLIAASDLELNQLKGIGIGLPGPVDFARGIPVAPPMMPNWDQYPIIEFWSKHFECPCFVDNDVNNMALGEHSVGLRFSVQHLIFVEAGAGIGAGVVYNGSLYRGADGSAGDIGHFSIGGSRNCWCGRTGCLEAEASLNAIQLKIAEATGRQMNFEEMKQAFLRLDINMIDYIRNSGQLIGKVIAAIVNFSNPSLVVLGGQLTEFGDVFLASVRQSIYENTLTLASRHLQINTSVLGDQVGLIGGAYMTIDQLIIQATNNDPDQFF
jgi:predicted NBD/HSP70 family sugar kinase